jgi:hypothetical protein
MLPIVHTINIVFSTSMSDMLRLIFSRLFELVGISNKLSGACSFLRHVSSDISLGWLYVIMGLKSKASRPAKL